MSINHKSQVKTLFQMLYIIGLGLGDIKDITVRGLEIVRKCDKVKSYSIT